MSRVRTLRRSSAAPVWAGVRSFLTRALALALVLAAFAPTHASAQVAVPPVARVTDQTGTLTSGQRAALDAKLADLERRKGSQLAVLLVRTTEPEAIEQYAIRVAEAWRLGRQGVDDGAILLVALDDRAMRIEVGYGLEGTLTDLAAHRIVEEYLRPQFRAGHFHAGIDAAVDRMIGLIDGEPLPPPPSATPRPAGSGFEALFPVFLIAGLVAGPLLRRMLGRPLGATATGGLAAFLAWLLAGALAIAVFAGIVTFLFTLLGGLGGGQRWASGRRGGWGGGFGGGGFGGGGFGGGGLGGGGFRGGGGGFGGGGASGRW